MKLANRPRLVIVFVVLIFSAIFGLALCIPTYVTSFSSHEDASTVIVMSFSYLHSNTLSDKQVDYLSQAHYDGLFYFEHAYVYSE